MMTNVPLVTAFVAGVASFSSPCVLPLIPIYLAHLAGVSAGETGARARSSVLANALAFIAGFSLVFVLLGAALGAAAGRGATGAVLEVRASNLAAQALYARFGFRVAGRRKNYYRDPPEDALVMTRPLGAAA